MKCVKCNRDGIIENGFCQGCLYEKRKEGYERGHRNGHCDRLLGVPALVVALTSHEPGYARGYSDGYYGK